MGTVSAGSTAPTEEKPRDTIFMTKEFEFMDKKFATKDDLASLRSELTRTIYLTSLGQLLAIVASVVSIIMILKK